jgi:hypothetical protein
VWRWTDEEPSLNLLRSSTPTRVRVAVFGAAVTSTEVVRAPTLTKASRNRSGTASLAARRAIAYPWCPGEAAAPRRSTDVLLIEEAIQSRLKPSITTPSGCPVTP